MVSPANPAAFPQVPGDSNAYEGHPGMSLRDWFAGQALNGIMCAEAADVIYDAAGAAGRAYRLADAMLAEHQKREADEPAPVQPAPMEQPGPFDTDMEAAPTDGQALMGRLADDTETAMVWWHNWPGWRATKAWNDMGEPITPVAWRRLTKAESDMFDDIPF